VETVLPLPPWHGIWYLVSPKNGLPVEGAALLTAQTLPSGKNVLAAVMFPANGSLAITVYSYSKDAMRHSSCTGTCALVWPPLLTTGSPQATASLPPPVISV
jgi:predicted lipoprotein with Yx(FWY)xxD motif